MSLAISRGHQRRLSSNNKRRTRTRRRQENGPQALVLCSFLLVGRLTHMFSQKRSRVKIHPSSQVLLGDPPRPPVVSMGPFGWRNQTKPAKASKKDKKKTPNKSSQDISGLLTYELSKVSKRVVLAPTGGVHCSCTA